MKRKIITTVAIMLLCTFPLSVFAEWDSCYENPTQFDEYGNPTAYGEHWWQYDYSEDATCEEDGYIEYYCENCYQTKWETIPATGHDWSKPDLIDSPSRYDTLIWGSECLNGDCEEVRYAPIKIKKGKKKRLMAKRSIKNLRKLSNRSIKWTSSKKKVATVSNGVVKARKKGTTYIKAKIYVKKYRAYAYIKYKVVVR